MGLLIISIVLGFLLAFIPTMIMKGQLKSVEMQRAAKNYEVKGSFVINGQYDRYLYKTIDKEERPKENQES